MEYKVIQFNAGRGSISTREIIEYARNAGFDVVLLQEPYVINDKIPCGYGRIFHGGDQGQPVRTAAVVMNERISAIMRGNLTTNDCVCVRVDQNGCAPCNMVSVYRKGKALKHALISNTTVLMNAISMIHI